MPLVPTSSRGGDGIARGTLVPAQILALFSTPITLVAGTPGALTIPDTFTTFYKSGTTTYTVPGSPAIDVGNLLVQGNRVIPQQFANLLTTGPPNDVFFDFLIDGLPSVFSASDTSAALGQGLVLSMDTGNPTLGNLTVTYELAYRVISP